jgi:hypothetical protein
MAVRSVDLRGVLIADLSKGRLRLRDERPVLALPLDALRGALDAGGTASVHALGASLGAVLASAALEALGDGPSEASPEDVAFAINTALARLGMGRLHFVRWGDALVACWSDAPASSGSLAALCAAALASCLRAMIGVDASACVLESEGATLEVLIADESVCAHARALETPTLASILPSLRPETVS